MKYCETCIREMVKIYFGILKDLGKIHNKLKSKGFLGSSLSIYDCSTPYTA